MKDHNAIEITCRGWVRLIVCSVDNFLLRILCGLCCMNAHITSTMDGAFHCQDKVVAF